MTESCNGILGARRNATPDPDPLITLTEAAAKAGITIGLGKFELEGKSLGKLVDEKQKAYGDSFGKAGEALKVLYPDGVMPEQYSDLLAIARILDKLFRVANRKDAFGENPYRDIAGYALLGAVKP